MWLIIKERENIPNAETIAALDDTEFNSYDNVDELFKTLSVQALPHKLQ
jgi:hypothetical protein